MRAPSRRLVLLAAVAAAVPLALSASSASAAPGELADSGGASVRNGAGKSIAFTKAARPGGGGGGKPRSNGINYNGGPVMLGTTNVYYIWYGSWSSTSQAILTTLAQNVGGSPYFNINTTYYNGSGTHLSNSVRYVASATDDLSQGSNLSDAQVQSVVSLAISNGSLPKDTNGVYFVLTAAGVEESSGFGTQYCGWHTHGNISGSDIKYSFVGNPGTKYLSACAEQSTGPNGDPQADAMASVIAHELEEAATDPDLNAWYDSRGYENADKCAWTFGTTYTANGALANMKLGTRNYLIQRNWVNATGGYCSLSY